MGQLDMRLPGVDGMDSTGGTPDSPRPHSLASTKQADLAGLAALTKSDSTGAQSFRSCASIPVIGAHPYGTLRVHQPAESPLARELPMKSLPDDPPPLVAGPDEDDDHQSEHAMGGGDIVLILDLPGHFTVGYDSVSFNTKSFHGVRDLPPGAHFFWVSETEASTSRTGFWVVTHPSKERVHVMQWDKFNEVLGPPASQVEARIQRENLPTIYPKLAPYQYRAINTALKEPKGSRSSPMQEPDFAKSTSIWRQLTSSISEPLLTRVTGRQAPDFAVHTSDRVKGALMLPAEIELEHRLHSVIASTELSFAFSQAVKTYATDVVGAERTEQAVDATSHLLSLIDSPTSDLTADDLVGEFQFAFVVGMLLGNEACVQQWWHMLLALVLKSYSLPLRKPSLARALLQTLTAQLIYNDRYLDGSILDYGPSNARDLRLSLIVYKRRLNETLLALNSRASPDQAAVGTAFSELEAWMWKHGWDIRSDYLRSGKTMLEDGEEVEVEMSELAGEDERGEYAAVVVELDDKGRQKDLVSWE